VERNLKKNSLKKDTKSRYGLERRETDSRTISSKRWYKQEQISRVTERASVTSVCTNKRKCVCLSLSRTDTQGDNTRSKIRTRGKKIIKKKFGTKSAVRIQKEKKNSKRDVIGSKLLLRDVIG
jgi:hypothetical protein